MQVESSATPLLTEDKASSLPGQFCPFHPYSELELVEKEQGFCCVYRSKKNVLYVCPRFRMKRGRRADHVLCTL